MFNMNWDDLHYAVALHEAGTLTSAAGELGVSHTTVARRIAALEDELGTPLFERTPNGYVPTHAGEDVLSVARSMQQQLDTLDRRVLGGDARLTGSLRVTTIDAFATYHAAELGAFCTRFPGVELEVSVDNRPRSLTKREADVAIRFSNNPPEHLVGRRLGRIEFAVYGSDELVESLGNSADISVYPWLAWCATETATLTDAFVRAHVPSSNIAYRVDSALSMFAAVRAGIGLSFLGCLWADQTPGLRRVRDIEPGFGVDLWALTHADLRKAARLRAFMEHLSTAMKPYGELMAGKRPRKPPLGPAT